MTVYAMADRRELFVDRRLSAEFHGTALRLHEPVSGGVAIRLDHPWEGPVNGPRTIFPLDGRWLMYYRAMTLTKGDVSGMLCLATSTDGVHWEKPILGVAEHLGSRANNGTALADGTPFAGVPWLDTRPGVPTDERIKALTSEALSGEAVHAFADPRGPKRLVLWVSADGAVFRRLDPPAAMISPLRNAFDGGNTLFWSEAEQQYVLYYRIWDQCRSMARTTSPDLRNWTDSVPMTYGETPREHLYTNSTQPYCRAPHHYLAPAARFMPGRKVLSDARVAAIGLHQAQGHSFANDCSETVLLSARPGETVYEREFMSPLVRPGLGDGHWISRTNYPFAGLYQVDEQHLGLWLARHYMQDSWHVERFLWRLDGLSSLSAPYAGGEWLSQPLSFSGQALELNYRTSAAGSLRAELRQADGTPVAGYGLADCVDLYGDELARQVSWRGGALAALAGQPLRLRLVMKDADLFSMRFVD